jgi:hypothetical protein
MKIYCICTLSEQSQRITLRSMCVWILHPKYKHTILSYIFSKVLHTKLCSVTVGTPVSYQRDLSFDLQPASRQPSIRFSLVHWYHWASHHLGSLTGHMHAAFVSENLPFLLEDVPLRTHQTVWFHNDDCPEPHAHIARHAHHCIRCLGPVWWPSHSLDLTLLLPRVT